MRMRVGCCIVGLMVMLLLMSSALAEDGIVPYYTSTSSMMASITISGGVANCEGRIVPIGLSRTSITVRLQRKSDSGSWSTICTWSDSNQHGKSQVIDTKTVTSGYDYRVYATGKVYNSSGSVIETVNKYSSVVSY